MVIDPHPYAARTFDLGQEQTDAELEELRDRMRGKPVGWATTTATGTPAVVVTEATAHALEVGRAELSRRERRRAERKRRRQAVRAGRR